MLTVEQIKQRLEDRNIMDVSRATGIHQNTIYKLNEKSSYKVVKALYDYLEQNL